MFIPTSLSLLKERHPLEMDLLRSRLGCIQIEDAGYRFHVGTPIKEVSFPDNRHEWSEDQIQFAQWMTEISSLQLAGHARGRVAVVGLNTNQLLNSSPLMWPIELLQNPLQQKYSSAFKR